MQIQSSNSSSSPSATHPLCDIQSALQELRTGRMLILADDESRENEGDLIIAAEHITPEAINFMATHGRGLICLALSPALTDKLNLPPMTAVNNSSPFGTNFTVSIEARHGVTTGISAHDRATTILTAISNQATPNDLVSPGHIFPLRARTGGVLVRCGHTEGSVDLTTLAGLKSAAVICEVMSDDGHMARLPELQIFAQKHSLKVVTIRDLIRYRLRHDPSLIRRGATVALPTKYGNFTATTYTNTIDNVTHLALLKAPTEIAPTTTAATPSHPSHTAAPPLVRVHSECLTGDTFASYRCDCGTQLEQALQLIATAPGGGILLYLRQEGRGIGLEQKIHAYALQEQGYDTVEANRQLGFAADLRDYGIGAQILADLGVTQMKLLTNNPQKLAALDGYGLQIIERIPLTAGSCAENACYLATKKNKMHHLL
jgi:3,4-dihydroxy 2-butanone 4-phosphate synthase / GTP cyclohydrolase II